MRFSSSGVSTTTTLFLESGVDGEGWGGGGGEGGGGGFEAVGCAHASLGVHKPLPVLLRVEGLGFRV